MKLTVFFLLLLLTLQPVTAQQIPPSVAKPELWQKSKTQRTVGWLLFGSGATVSIVGLAVGANNFWDDLIHDKVKGEGAFYTGLGLMAASVPFFIMAGKNRRLSLQPTSFQPPRFPNLFTSNKLFNGFQIRFTQTLSYGK